MRCLGIPALSFLLAVGLVVGVKALPLATRSCGRRRHSSIGDSRGRHAQMLHRSTSLSSRQEGQHNGNVHQLSAAVNGESDMSGGRSGVGKEQSGAQISPPSSFHHEPPTQTAKKLRARLLKSLRDVSLRYDMIEPNDRIMVCVSGGKDSATLLHLLLHLQSKLAMIGNNFELVAVHLNQMQPGYDNTILIEWLDSLDVPYRIVTEDTYSIVTEKTPANKAYCSLCSRLRRGILYTVAHELKCNKIALGHHGDDAMETLLLNMVHGGAMKGMPARYHSASRDVHVLRPLISCLEKDIAEFAREMEFPILPCNLCGSQDDLHRGKAKLLCDAMETMNPNARRNVITAMGNVKPSHLLDENLRIACGLDGKTGSVVDEVRAQLIGEMTVHPESNNDNDNVVKDDLEGADGVAVENGDGLHRPSSFIENLL